MLIKESDLLTYVDKGYLSIEKRNEYLTRLNIIRVFNGEVFIRKDDSGHVSRTLNDKGESCPKYEVANEEIDSYLHSLSKKNKLNRDGSMGVDVDEVAKVVNKIGNLNEIDVDEIPF